MKLKPREIKEKSKLNALDGQQVLVLTIIKVLIEQVCYIIRNIFTFILYF